jgi:hypothetical protein
MALSVAMRCNVSWAIGAVLPLASPMNSRRTWLQQNASVMPSWLAASAL